MVKHQGVTRPKLIAGHWLASTYPTLSPEWLSGGRRALGMAKGSGLQSLLSKKQRCLHWTRKPALSTQIAPAHHFSWKAPELLNPQLFHCFCMEVASCPQGSCALLPQCPAQRRTQSPSRGLTNSALPPPLRSWQSSVAFCTRIPWLTSSSGCSARVQKVRWEKGCELGWAGSRQRPPACRLG